MFTDHPAMFPDMEFVSDVADNEEPGGDHNKTQFIAVFIVAVNLLVHFLLPV